LRLVHVYEGNKKMFTRHDDCWATKYIPTFSHLGRIRFHISDTQSERNLEDDFCIRDFVWLYIRVKQPMKWKSGIWWTERTCFLSQLLQRVQLKFPTKLRSYALQLLGRRHSRRLDASLPCLLRSRLWFCLTSQRRIHLRRVECDGWPARINYRARWAKFHSPFVTESPAPSRYRKIKCCWQEIVTQ
jgi:hypothetical protein